MRAAGLSLFVCVLVSWKEMKSETAKHAKHGAEHISTSIKSSGLTHSVFTAGATWSRHHLLSVSNKKIISYRSVF